MPKIQITRGRVEGNEVSHNHLVRNHLIAPNRNIDKIMMYAEKRYLMTFLTAGVRDARFTSPGMIGTDTAKTVVKQVPEAEMLPNKAWQYKVMGRIQRSSVIVSQVGNSTQGSTTVGGFFTLKMQDDMLKPGMNAIFYNGKIARVQGRPTGTPGNWLYRFQCKPGDTFVYATWVAPQVGQKTCFGGYSTYGERSLRGYGHVYYPDTYINHMTIQRKSMGISGDANVEEVTWYEYNGVKGYTTDQEIQMRTQFLLEDEFQKWWGVSNMRDANGNLIASPTHFDEESGEPIIEGDGWMEQVRGSNDFETSGADGTFTYDDLADMVSQIKKKSNFIGGGLTIYAVTGTDGMRNAEDVISARHIALGGSYTATTSSVAGGAHVDVGFNFTSINIAGCKVIFTENPMMDDEMKFPARLSNGKLRMSNTVYLISSYTDNTGRPNMEIRARGRNGINRNWVMLWKNGMTGEGTAQEPVDAKEYHVLKENMLTVYDVNGMGIMSPYAGA